MWEDVSPQKQSEEQTMQRPVPKRNRKPEADYLFWAQVLLCTALAAVAFCARAFSWPIQQEMRAAYTAAMQLPELDILGEERSLARFTQQTAAELVGAAREVFAMLRAATPESAAPADAAQTRRRSANEPDPPPGSRAESYLPPFDLCYPLPNADASNTSGYGWRIDPVQGEGAEFHTGADLAVAEGTPVLAAADGVVRMAGAHSSYGNYLRILHAGGDETLYAHMQYLYVRPGEQVQRGQMIGTSGQTGNVTGPHLHFELLHEGIRYDPAEALRQAAG